VPHSSKPLTSEKQVSPETYQQFANLIKNQAKKKDGVSSYDANSVTPLAPEKESTVSSSSDKLKSATTRETGLTLSHTSSGQQFKEEVPPFKLQSSEFAVKQSL